MTADHSQQNRSPQGKESRRDTASSNDGHPGSARRAYLMLGLNVLLSFGAMYLLMYAMIDSWGDFYHNLNMGLMALAMAAPMGAIMLATMPGMYPKKRANVAIYAACAIVFVAAFVGI